MKYFSVLITAMLFSSTANAGPAGVIPYACMQDGAYFLMAFDPVPGRQAYAAFGGTAEAGETEAETAARELREETRCIFDGPTADSLGALTPSVDHGYTAYIVEVPFVSPLAIEDNSCNARKERDDWLWVRWADLRPALLSDDPSPRVVASLAHKYIRIWDKAASSMRAAMGDGLLPEAGLCPSGL